MSNDNPKTPRGYQPPRQGRPGEERKPSLNRNIGGKSSKASRQEPVIQPKGLPQGARPSGVETYGSSNWRPPTHKPSRPQPAEKPPAPSLFERFPILQTWKDKLVALWRKRFPSPEGTPEGEDTANAPDRFAKAKELKASWGKACGAIWLRTRDKTSASFTKVGEWWHQTWSSIREKMGPPLANAWAKTSALAGKVGNKCSQALGAAFGFLGTWGNKGAALAQKTAKQVRDKMPELPPASEVVRKLPGVGASLDAIDAAKSKRAQAAITTLLAETLQSLAQRDIEAAAALKPEPCGNEFVAAKMANGEAATWLTELQADRTEAAQLPPLLFHRPNDAMRLLAVKQRIYQEHLMLWQEGTLQPVLTLAFVLHARRAPLHLLELVIFHMANLIAIQIDDSEVYESFLWHTKQAVQVATKDDSSRVARQALSVRSSGAISQELYDEIIAGLGQLV